MTGTPTLLSLGHGRRNLGEFLDLVLAAGIETVVDVRARPGSRRHPQFARAALADALREAGIEYVFEGRALGGYRVPAGDSRHAALSEDALRGYAEHMESPEFRVAAARVLERARREVVAFLCAEHFPADCHRRLLADWFAVQGARVRHAVERGRLDDHVLHPALRVAGTALIYDGGRGRQQTLF